jgi:hypothetical protein
MIVEAPIKTSVEDIFERNSFAYHFADLLILKESSPSLVLALEGKWGSGKTSIINMVKEAIKKKSSEAVIVDFNPWLIGSLDSVIEGFLVQFAASVNQTLNTDTASKAAVNLITFAKFLAPIKLIPGVEPWGTIVEKVISSVGLSAKAAVDMTKLDLRKRKNAVQQSIDDIGKPIIVIIDDIDRLPPAEVRTVIQVIKAIADFDRVSYLLAYEPEPVIKSLEYNGTYDGRRYLEKIVQAAYPIPRIGYWHLKGFLRNHINNMFMSMELTTSAMDDQLLNYALDSTAIVRALSTPRDAIRLVNRLTITAKNTWGEVSVADMLAFETLELKYPKISTVIRNNPGIFLKTSVAEGDYIDQDYFDQAIEDFKEGEDPACVRELFTEFEPLQIKNIRSIMGFIFPTMFKTFGHHSQDEAVRTNRICTRESLLKLLHSGPNKYLFSSEEVKHFFETESDRRQILLDYLESGSIVGWLQYANQFIDKSRVNNPLSICLELLEVSRSAHIDYNINLTDNTSALILSLIYNGEDSKQLIRLIASNEKSISVSEHVICRLLSKYLMWSNGVYNGGRVHSEHELERFPFPPDQLIIEKNIWIETVRMISLKPNFFKDEPEPISILFRWGQLNDNNYDEVQNYLERFTLSDEGLILFLNCFTGSKGLDGIEKLIKNTATLIARIESISNKVSNEGVFAYLKAVESRNAPTD